VAAYPTSGLILNLTSNPDGRPELGAHTDYALNGGASIRPDVFEVKWPGIWERLPWPDKSINPMKRIGYKGVKDGLSKTYLIGEKSVSSNHYMSGRDPGDDSSIFDCAGGNCVRFAKRVPIQDRPEAENNWSGQNFGSAHPTSWNAVFCDGSVHSLSYEMDFSTHAALASRAAGDRANFPE
jgi:hypothetical protein